MAGATEIARNVPFSEAEVNPPIGGLDCCFSSPKPIDPGVSMMNPLAVPLLVSSAR